MTCKSWVLTIEGNPQTKQRARHDPNSGAVRTPDRTSTFEQRVAGAALEAGVRWIDGYVFEVKIGIWLKNYRPKDGDNIEKVVLDGLQKGGKRCLPNDDLFHVPACGTQLLGVSKAFPKIVVEIYRRRARGDEAGSPERKKR